MDHDNAIAAFIDVAGPETDPEVARALLEMHDWNVETALREILAIPPEVRASQDEVRAPMQTGNYERLIDDGHDVGHDDEMTRAVNASLRHQTGSVPFHSDAAQILQAQEASFSDHMQHAMAMSKMDSDYETALKMSADPERVTASRNSKRDRAAPSTVGTFDQSRSLFSVDSSKRPKSPRAGTQPFGQTYSSKASMSATPALPSSAASAEKKAPEMLPLFGGRTYDTQSKAGDPKKPSSPNRAQVSAQIQQELEAEQKRKRAALDRRKTEEPEESREPDRPVSSVDKEKEIEKERNGNALKCFQRLKRLEPEKLRAAMKTLHAYISNLAKNPLDEKFQRINMENKAFVATVAPHEDALELLKLCGFQIQGTYMVMDQAFIKSKGSFLWNILSKVEILRQ